MRTLNSAHNTGSTPSRNPEPRFCGVCQTTALCPPSSVPGKLSWSLDLKVIPADPPLSPHTTSQTLGRELSHGPEASCRGGPRILAAAVPCPVTASRPRRSTSQIQKVKK